MTPIAPDTIPSAWRGRGIDAWAKELGVPHLELVGSISSTNDRLRDLAEAGAVPLTTVIAGAQTLGRGRSGKAWHSAPDAGLWISVLLSGNRGVMGVLPLAVGVAVARALERYSPSPIELKWPNDLLVGGRKVAGILCESAGDGKAGIVVGIGVNLRQPVDGLPNELASSVVHLEEIADAPVSEPILARGLIGELGRWAHPAPTLLVGHLRAEWEARDCLRGRPVRIENGSRGIACGVSDDGFLEVGGGDGEVVLVRSGGVRLDVGDGSLPLHEFNEVRTNPGAV
jgi:BirA family biotin operon repressor/biotin-[acetyl-CoA-carboxylase] ligase